MDKKSISGYFILVVGIVLVMILTFGTSQQTRSAYVVNADEPTTTEGTTATATDADDGDDAVVPETTKPQDNSANASPELTPAPTLSPEEIAALSAEYSDIVSKKNDLQTKLNTLLDSQNNFITTLNNLDDLIIEYQDKIDVLRESVSRATELQIEMGADLEKAELAQAAQYEIVKSHIRDEYESGTYTYIDAFFDATDYSDLVNRAEYINAIDAYDEKILQEYIDAKQLLKDKSALVSSLASDQQVLQDAYQQEQDSLQMISDAKERQVNSYQANIDEMQAMVDELDRQQNEYIAKIEASYQVQYSSNGNPNATTGLVYTGEQFLWPMPSGHTIVSYYGPRVAPTAGATSYHRGIDIDCGMGSEVVAVAAGEVIYTGYLGSAGNAVIVDHGSGICSCYFHLSSFACQVGDKVTAGQVICYSGNTGVSTGPHLHFAVRENGEYVNPLKYFKEIEDKSAVANSEGE